ncbi:hypothetical protein YASMINEVIRUS_1266 [Yasminevirus sp. GU-2018]|uniref:Uncharacterized protein n=1 Tax=Yasminevirus sp. GU-2018 TaxID=2420051 RepID=A0A5K0UB57_9VIRU|nr:hypothetical protein YASMINEVIRUS_1266 [Yasminevirus sp. GU-2018]
MFDYILYALLFFLGTITKIILVPIYLFSGSVFNSSFNTLTKRILYYIYLVLNYILTFIVGSWLVASNLVGWFTALWVLLILVDVIVFVYFYNPAGNLLGAPVAFIVLVREMLFAIIGLVLLGVYYSADYETHLIVYGSMIWGFAGAKILDAFPKFYIFNSGVNSNTLVTPFRGKSGRVTSSPSLNPVEAILNAVNVLLLMFLSVFTAFFGSNIYTIIIAILYFLYVVGYFVYRKMTV